MKSYSKIWPTIVAIAFGITFLSSNMLAQTFKATLIGIVADANDAVVAGAIVTVTELGTGRKQTVMTNGEGTFSMTQLAPGKYELRIEATSFKTAVQNDLVLETDQTKRVNITLEAGDIKETVIVQADAPIVNTDTSSKGEVIVQKQVQDLPLNGRNFTDLALLAPGVYRRPADDDQGEGLATAGTRTDASNFILDGVVNRSDRNASVGVNTSIESIREFKVETSSYSAEFGRTAGAQISVVSKSGTNQFHGSLFEYLRNNIFDANNFFTAPGEDKKLRRNQYGGTIGGPILKDRTFFFFSYEGTREVRSESAASNAPNAAWLQGDFRNVRGPGKDGKLGNADDTNRVLCITTTGRKVECPVPNVIPFAVDPAHPEILPANPVSLEMAKLLPAANLGTLTGFEATLVGIKNRNQYTTKIDHKFSDNNNTYVRYSRESGDGFDPFPSDRNFFPGFGRDTTRKFQSLAISDTHIFSPQIVNEARVGVFWQRNEDLGENRDTDFIALFNIPGLPTASQTDLQGFPAIRIDGFSEFGDRPNDPFIYDISNNQFFDSLSLLLGKHSVKLGVDIVRSHYVEADVRNVRGDFRFRGRNTNPSGQAASGFYSFADFLYGLPDSTQRQIGADPADLSGWQYAIFAQDDWRVTPWLTLNLGLRYELQRPLTENMNRLANFIPSLGMTVVAGDPNFPESLVETDTNNIGPRVGFAMRPFKNDKTVIRGGAGIYYSLETFNPIRQQLAVSFPFVDREQFTRLSSNILLLSLQNPFPSERGATQGLATPFGLQVDYKVPEIYQYNLTVEHELTKDLALEVGYVGSLGRHLGIRYNLNAPLPVGFDTTTNQVITARRFPNLGDIQYQEQIASSSYNAFQASLRRRSHGGLTLLASYTFSRSIDTASSTNNSTTGTQKFPQDVSNFDAEKSLSDFHREHQFSGSFNYELPIGRGKNFLSGANGVTQYVLGDWQINGILTLLSGRPFTPQFTAADVAQQRPDLVGDPFSNIPAGLFFNPDAFARPVASASEPNLFGNAGRNILIGPGFESFDFSLSKNFRISEGVQVQFRAEIFNILNHPNFQVPVFTLDDPAVGQFRQTANEGREGQFALKIIF